MPKILTGSTVHFNLSSPVIFLIMSGQCPILKTVVLSLLILRPENLQNWSNSLFCAIIVSSSAIRISHRPSAYCAPFSFFSFVMIPFIFLLFLILRLIHIGDFFKREASDFILAPVGTGTLYSTIQIGDFPAIFQSENKNRSQTNGCCTHSSERFLFVVVGFKLFQLYCWHILPFKRKQTIHQKLWKKCRKLLIFAIASV